MSLPLLATKLYFPPPRPNLVPRPRLNEKLSAGLEHRLILVSAPPGFGKTSMVAAWISDLGLKNDDFQVRSGNLQATNQQSKIDNLKFAWLTLDEEDNNAARFFAYLVAALQTIDSGLGQGAKSLLSAPQLPPVEALVATLINDLAAMRTNAILVLDDYHLIHSQSVHAALGLLLERQPYNFHLVLLTREDPPLPLPRLRARGEMTEIREKDLRFSLDEVAAFLAQTMGLHLSQESIAALTNRTEGWIAGLQMAALALQGTLSPQDQGDAEEFIHAFQGDDRYVMDYLMEEVFRHQPQEIQDFLLCTSILERMCAPLCDEVLGDIRQRLGDKDSNPPTPLSPLPSQEILESLERANLFIVPLDNRRQWYRYHHLFGDLLHYRLERQSPQLLPDLHRRASRWYAQVGDPEQAMKHALAVPDHGLAADLAEANMLHMTGSSRIATYLNWVQQIPDEVIFARPYLCAGCGWAYVLTNQVDAAEKYVEAGQAALSHFEPIYDASDSRWITLEEVRGNLAAIRSYADRGRNDFSSAIEHANQALADLPPEAMSVRCAVALNLGMLYMDSGELGMARQAFNDAFDMAKKSGQNIYVAVSALAFLGGLAFSQGQLNEAARFFDRAIHFGTGEGRPSETLPGVGAVHGWLVALHYQRDEMAAAQEHLDIVLQTVAQLGVPETVMRAYLYQALLAQSRGEFSTAEDWYQKTGGVIPPHQLHDLLQTEWVVFRGQFYLAQGDLDKAASLLQEHGVLASDLEGSAALDNHQLRTLAPRLAQYLLLARVLLAQGNLDQSASLLERVSAIAEAIQNVEVLLETLVFQAILITSQRGDPAQALPYLKKALTLAAPEGYVRPFLNAGDPLANLLRQAIAQDIYPTYAHKLLTHLAEYPLSVGPVKVASEIEELIDPLTEREQQVLRLLAADLSSTEVAEQLIISVSTARSYIKNIYRKLDAHSRDEALEKGRQFGLI
ncbi:MAG: LuxR C-terminal-related transcriptional regulator [Anaerolineales bacterium]